MPALLLVVVQRHWRAVLLVVMSAAPAFWLGHRLGAGSVHCPEPPPCPEARAEASAGALTGTLGCRVTGWHLVDLEPPSLVRGGSLEPPPKTSVRTVEVLRTVPGAPLPAGPCTQAILVPDLALEATGAVQGPHAQAEAVPPPRQVVPVAVPGAGRWFPSVHAGGGSMGAVLGGGIGYRWASGHALALEGSAVMSVSPVQSRGWEARLRFDF